MIYLIVLFTVLFLCVQLMTVYHARQALAREERAVSDREEVVSFLNRFAQSIITSQDARAWMQLVAGYLADAIHANAIRIFLLEEDNILRTVAETGELPDVPHRNGHHTLTKSARLLEHLSHERIEVGEGLIGEVAFTGESQLLTDIANGDSSGQLQTVIAVPMAVDEDNRGVICAVGRRHTVDENFSRDDLYLLRSLAHQVGLGGALIAVYEQLSEQHRIHQELQLAREIQNSLLPKAAPKSDWFTVYGINKTAGEVSGDFFDFVELSDEFLLVLIADASGKGVPACMLMAMCRSFVRANAARYRDNLEGLFKELNANLFADTDGGKFVTVSCCLIDKRDGTVEYARAGHTELLIRQPHGQVQVISPDGPALGLLPESDVQFDTFSFSWLPRTSILLFTDGITEALNNDDEEYGLSRLIDSWRTAEIDPEHAAGHILESVDAFAQSQPQADDQTIVILSRTA